MNFKNATDQLFSQVDHEELATRLKVSVASVRQARLKPEAQAHRAPPKNWEKAVLELAEQRATHYRRLAEKMRQETRSPARPRQLNGRPITD